LVEGDDESVTGITLHQQSPLSITEQAGRANKPDKVDYSGEWV